MFDARHAFARCGFAAVLITSVPGGAVAQGVLPELFVVPAVTDNYILPDSNLAEFAGVRKLTITAAPGEYEPASFVIRAPVDTGPLRVRATPLRSAEGVDLAGAELDIRVVKRWYQSSFGARADKQLRYLTPELLVYDDTLVKVQGRENYVRKADGEYVRTSDPAMHMKRLLTSVERLPIRDAETLQPVTIAAGSNRQFWVTLHTPADALPGRYRSEVIVEQGGNGVVRLPVEVELLPITLADPMLEVGIYYRATLDRSMPEGSVSAEVKSEAQYLAELRNMIAHGVSSPTVYQKYSTGELERVLDLWEKADLRPPRLYYLGLNIVPNNDGDIPARLRAQVQDVVKLAGKRGFSEVYFYARDEALGDDLVYQFPFWDAVRDAGGRIMAAGWQTDQNRPGNFDVTGGNEDLFVALGTARRSESARWHDKGKLIYSYQNPTGGYEVAETYRRNFGLLLWQKNYDGSMGYAYQDSEGRAWHDFDAARNRDLSFTYPTVDGPVDTVQWEGFREGVDDLRYLQSLLELLADADGPAADEARIWVAELKDATLAQRDLDRVRSDMVGHILQLQSAVPAEPVRVESVSVSPISGRGTAVLEWRSDVRAGATAELSSAGQAFAMVGSSNLPAYQHRVELTGLGSAADYNYRLTANDAVLAEGSFGARPDIALVSAVAKQVDAGTLITAEVASDFESGIGIDWNRSLLGAWRFSAADDGDIADESTWNHVAELANDATLGPGRYGRGVVLDGEGDIVAVPGIKIPENGTATIEGWFRFDTFAMDIQNNIGIFSGLYQHASSNHFYLTRTNDYFFVGNLLEKDVWHHIALTWSGNAASATLYVDGRPIRVTVLADAEDIPAISGLSIGRSNGYLGALLGGARGTFAGTIDEVRVWSRVLSAAEIRAAWSAGRLGRLAVEFEAEPESKPEWAIIGANAADRTLRAGGD